MAIKDFRSKKCLITGAASGIGRATAVAMGAEGAELFLTDINQVPLDAVVKQIRDAGGTVTLAKAFDISSYPEVQAFGKEIAALAGNVDIVMNIAGISTWGTVENLQYHHWKKIIDVNLMGPIHVIETFMPAMVHAGKGGHLVNVSSAAGLLALPWHAAYSASKFGLRGLSDVLRFDLKRHNIGVSLVVPGGVKTGLVETLTVVGLERDDPTMKKMTQRFEKHAVSPEKVASVIIKGMRNGTYLVYTSMDIRIGYLALRYFPLPYEMVMQKMNDVFSSILIKQQQRKLAAKSQA